MKPNLYIALPHRPGESVAMGLLQSLWCSGGSEQRALELVRKAVRNPDDHESIKAMLLDFAANDDFTVFDFRASPMSLLNLNFNTLWVAARNCRTAWFHGQRDHNLGVKITENPYLEQWGAPWEQGWREADGEKGNGPVTHFVMCHSDVVPVIVAGQDGKLPTPWLTKMVRLQKKYGCDVLTTVIPLKDDSGDTSTGVMNWKTGQFRKLSLDECLNKLPSTFQAKDVGPDCDAILTNTGLWIADITKPWARRICFRSYDTILLRDNGIDEAASTGEDWLMGVDLYRLGLKVMATTEIHVDHQGTFRYPNFVSFGKSKNEGKWGMPWCVQPPSFWAEEAFRGDGNDHKIRRAQLSEAQ